MGLFKGEAEIAAPPSPQTGMTIAAFIIALLHYALEL